MPPLTLSEKQALFQEMISENARVSSNTTWSIPLWITYVRDSSGQSYWDDKFSPFQAVEEMNQYFNNGMNFYLCGVTYIESNVWHHLNLQQKDSLQSFANALNPEYNKGYIDVFVVGSTIPAANGWAYYPITGKRGAVILVGTNNSDTFAHELGHFFNLAHTDEWGNSVPNPLFPYAAQYVHHLTDPESHPVYLINKWYTCWETGDGICDTPADPGQCAFEDDCVTLDHCNDPLDPLGLTYNPEPDFIMGPTNAGCPRTRFSDQQNIRMISRYTTSQAWNYISDSIVPTCQTLANDIGIVRRNCKNIFISGAPAPDVTPIEGAEIFLLDSASQFCGAITPITNQIGRYVTHNCVYPTYDGTGLLSILPDKDYANNPLNGVSTWDLVLISKHILGLEPFTSPFQHISADANNSGSVTTFDIVEIRKLILGITNGVSAGSWRYVPEYCFENQSFSDEFYDDDDPNTVGAQFNPFNALWTNPDETNGQQRNYGGGGTPPNSTSWMDHVSINPNATTAQAVEPWSLWGVKTGGVNCSVDVDGEPTPPPADGSFLTTSHNALSTNQEFILQIRAMDTTAVSAWQFGVKFNKDYLQILEVLPGNSGEPFSLDNFGLTHTGQGEFRALNYDSTGAATGLYDKILFKLRMEALQSITNVSQHFLLKNDVLEQMFYTESGDELESMGLQLEVASEAYGLAGGVSGIKDASSHEAYQLSVHPVPFTSEIVFDFYLPEGGEAGMSFYDGLGQLVSQSKSSLSKGANSLTLNNLASLPTGFYWYLIEVNGQKFYGKLVKN